MQQCEECLKVLGSMSKEKMSETLELMIKYMDQKIRRRSLTNICRKK